MLIDNVLLKTVRDIPTSITKNPLVLPAPAVTLGQIINCRDGRIIRAICYRCSLSQLNPHMQPIFSTAVPSTYCY